MTIEQPSLEAKRPIMSESAIGIQQKGGIVLLPNGTIRLLKHDRFRYRHNGFGSEYPFWGMGDTESLTTWPIEGIDRAQTAELCSTHLRLLSEGIRPSDNTTGIEFEGSMYDWKYNLMSVNDDVHNPLAEAAHPELMHFTLESATNGEKGHLVGPVQVAKGLGISVSTAYSLAESMEGSYVLSSVPEGGDRSDGTITPHPYLQLFAPIVRQQAALHSARIPQETLDLYREMGVDVQNELAQDTDLNWPMQCLHIHQGVARHKNGEIDMRVALVNAHIRQTKFAKTIGFMLFGTTHMYSHKTDLHDVRSIAKRMLNTTHDSELPLSEQEYMVNAIGAVEEGTIHSKSRYPASGQHDRVRIRDLTVESIEYPISPDLRAILVATFAQEIMDTIAKEALVASNGDEVYALQLIQEKYGSIMETQTSLGEDSAHEWDVIFNKSGYKDPKILWAHKEMMRVINEVGRRYEPLRVNADLITHYAQSVTHPVDHPDLASRLGLTLEDQYDQTVPILGLVSEHKRGMKISELIDIQHKATKAQAASLSKVTSTEDLYRYFGIDTVNHV